MKPIATIITIALAVTAFGCNDSAPPKSEARVETASEAARNDYRDIAERLAQQKAAVDAEYQKTRARESRQRYVDILRSVSKRWDNALNEARNTPRNKIATQMTALQAISKDVNAIDVDDCTGNARDSLQMSMATSIAALNGFQKETGETSESAMKKMTEGAEQLRTAQAEIEACLIK